MLKHRQTAPKNKKRYKNIRHLTVTLASVIVFFTVYFLILPAIALESDNNSVTQGMGSVSQETEVQETDLQGTDIQEIMGDSSVDGASLEGADAENSLGGGTLEPDLETEASEADNTNTSEANSAMADADMAASAGAEEAPASEMSTDDLEATMPLPDITILTSELGALTVTAYVSPGVLPAGAELKVTDVPEVSLEENGVLNAVGEIEEKSNVATAYVVDAIEISFIDEENQVIEPESPVYVELSCDKFEEFAAEETESLQVLKVDPEAELAEEAVVEIQSQNNGEKVSFSVDNMTVYALVGTTMLEKNILASDGVNYRIQVVLDKREAFTNDQLDLSVIEIEENTTLYEDYLAGAVESMMLDSVEDITFARFFDITILQDNQKYEPIFPVQVTISYADPIDLSGEEQLSVVHFADGGTEVIRDITLSSDGTEVSYEQGSFSVTGTVTAVNSLQNGDKVVIYTRSGSNYYAISHFSDGRDNDRVYAAKLDSGSTNNGQSISVSEYDSNIVWTFNIVTRTSGTYYTFSYVENGVTYYLRTCGGILVGSDNDVVGYTGSDRYQFSYNDHKLRSRSNNNNNGRYLSFVSDGEVIRERANGSSDFYFAKVTEVTAAPATTPTIHYVDESGNPLTVVNGRDWDSDTTTTPAYLIYDIDGYEYVKTTLGNVNGTQIRPILRLRSKWQYTTSMAESNSISWTNIPSNQDIYVVYKKATDAPMGGTPKVKESSSVTPPADPTIKKDSVPNGDGTNTMSLSITADTSPLEVEKLADVIVIFDCSNSMERDMNGKQRLQAAKDSVNSLAEMLIGSSTTFKNSAGDKLIRMALIRFSADATIVQGFTDDYNTYSGAVNNLSRSAGTNWEAALAMANNMAVDSERATFIIFVTDGNPSYRVSRGNLYEGTGYPDTVSDASLDIYKTNSSYQYRVNSLFGALDENDERNLNTAQVKARSIVNHNKILYSIGIGNANGVSRLQGLTGYAYDNAAIGAARTKTAENQQELLDAFSEIASSIVALLGWSDINMTDGITNLTNTVEKTGLVGVDGSFTYWKAPAPSNWSSMTTQQKAAYTPGASSFVSWDPASENCQPATYADGAVKWEMGANFVPEAGATYQVRFKVWPSQEAYDILAKCKNDPTYYDTLSSVQQAQILRTGEYPYTYTLKTNEDGANTTYKAAQKTGSSVTTSGDERTILFNTVNPLGLASDKIGVAKEWHYIDSTQPTSITMNMVDETGNVYKVITLTGTPGATWTDDDINISTGLMTIESGVTTIYEKGHDFTLTEPISSENLYWELTSETFHPMVINNETKMLIKVDSAAKAEYTIDGKYYKEAASGARLTAVNDHRSYLDLTKVIQDNVPTDQLFEFTITINDARGEDTYFTVRGNGQNLRGVETTAAEQMNEGVSTGYYLAANNTSFTIKLQAGWNVRFLNLSNGTTYTITESSTGDTFEFVSVEGSANEITRVGSSTSQIAVDPHVTIDEDHHQISGTIEAANRGYKVTYTNKTSTRQVTLLKTTEEGTSSPLAGATFELYTKVGYESTPKASPIKTDIVSSSEEGKVGVLDLGQLALGDYYLVETNAPAGYIPLSDPITLKVQAGSISIVQGSTQREDSTPDDEEYAAFITNTTGYELPSTGGAGTRRFYALGAFLLLLGGAALVLLSRKFSH